MSPECFRLVQENNHKKGDVLSVARIAGIQGFNFIEKFPFLTKISIFVRNLDFCQKFRLLPKI